MSRYIQILSVQRPFGIGKDDADRFVYSCNYDALAVSPVTKFEEEIAKLLVDAGLGAVGTTIFTGAAAVFPSSGPGPFTNIIDQGGVPPRETHNGSKYVDLRFQIIVCGVSHTAVRARALAIWDALDGVRNVTVTV